MAARNPTQPSGIADPAGDHTPSASPRAVATIDEATAASVTRRRRQVTYADDLATARAVRARQQARVQAAVEAHMEQLARESYRVPWLHVEITGSLPTASALQVIEHFSGQARASTGSGWVRLPLQRWMNSTGLCEDQWLAARQDLRDLGLIRERRHFDLEAGGIAMEIELVPEAFALEVARLREAILEEAWQGLKARQPD